MLRFLKTKVCIVGSGFCGYAAYKKLKNNKVNVVLVEGGNIDTPKSYKEQINYLVKTNKFLKNKEKKLINNNLELSFRDRKFTLGGSSECWSGWIKPLEKSTYENIFPGNENQTWGDLKLTSFEDEVLRLLNSPINNFDTNDLVKKLNLKLPILPQGLDFSTYAWAEEPLRLKSFWIKRLAKNQVDNNEDKDVIFGYSLKDFLLENKSLKKLKFQNKDNQNLYVEADYFILCMGGVENARFTKKLLDKNNTNTNLVGNFQEHPHLFNIAGFNRDEKILPPILCQKIDISNSSDKSFKNGKVKIAISAWDGPGTPKTTFMIRENPNNIKDQFKNFIKQVIQRKRIPLFDYSVTMRCEQTPNRKSNLNFNGEKTSLNWNIIESDFEAYSKYLRRFSSFLILNKFAKDFTLSESAINSIAYPKSVKGGAHHCGTVPYMRTQNLIKNNFSLKGFENTYVVGSSSFPTSGFENPTHAAMATALIAAKDIIKK